MSIICEKEIVTSWHDRHELIEVVDSVRAYEEYCVDNELSDRIINNSYAFWIQGSRKRCSDFFFSDEDKIVDVLSRIEMSVLLSCYNKDFEFINSLLCAEGSYPTADLSSLVFCQSTQNEVCDIISELIGSDKKIIFQKRQPWELKVFPYCPYCKTENIFDEHLCAVTVRSRFNFKEVEKGTKVKDYKEKK